MAIKLSRQELENIKTCRYTTNPATKMDIIFDHWWTWLTNRLPMVSYFSLASSSKGQVLVSKAFV